MVGHGWSDYESTSRWTGDRVKPDGQDQILDQEENPSRGEWDTSRGGCGWRHLTRHEASRADAGEHRHREAEAYEEASTKHVHGQGVRLLRGGRTRSGVGVRCPHREERRGSIEEDENPRLSSKEMGRREDDPVDEQVQTSPGQVGEE